MAVTPEGLRRMAELVLGQIAALEVSDGAEQSARSVTIEAELTDEGLRLVSEFDSGFANFDWRERRVILTDGTAFDVEAEDLGRKAEGSVWTLEIVVVLTRLESQGA